MDAWAPPELGGSAGWTPPEAMPKPAQPAWSPPELNAAPKQGAQDVTASIALEPEQPKPTQMPGVAPAIHAAQQATAIPEQMRPNLQDAKTGFVDSFQGGEQQFSEGMSEFPRRPLTGAAKMATGAMSELFAPVSGLFESLAKPAERIGTAIGNPELGQRAGDAIRFGAVPGMAAEETAAKGASLGHSLLEHPLFEAKPPEPVPMGKPPEVKAQPQAVGASTASLADILRGSQADMDKAKIEKSDNALKTYAKAIRATVSPETVSAASRRAVENIRSTQGRKVRADEQTRAIIDGLHDRVKGATQEQQIDMALVLDGEGDANKLPQGHREVAKAYNNVMAYWRSRLEELPQTEKMAFVQNYFSRQYKNSEAAQNFVRAYGAKQGSGGMTKGRAIPKLSDAIRAGLVPTLDPLENMATYVQNASSFVARHEALNEGERLGDIKFVRSGKQMEDVAPGSYAQEIKDSVPEGWVKLDGASVERGGGMYQAYAPEDYARIYNNFVSKRYDGSLGTVLDGFQKAGNTVTALKFSLSAYHAVTEIKEAIASKLSQSFDETSRGQFGKAASSLATSPAAFVRMAKLGGKAQRAYVGDLSGTSPEFQRTIDLLTEANMRFVGKGSITDEYRFSGKGSYYTSYMRGLLRDELRQDALTSNPMSFGLKQAMRIMDTTMHPLFETYIPKLKVGAAMDMLGSWLEAHPNATHGEQAAFARHVSDVIDDRFGEMNRDNIFWTNKQKQFLSSIMTSFSYELGTVRTLAGAAKDTATAPARAMRGQKVWTPKMSYALAEALTAGVFASAYQFYMTHKAPTSLQDLIAPQTGTKDRATGKPSRAVLPGADKDMRELYYKGPIEWAENKPNPFLKSIEEAITMKDGLGRSIYLHRDGFAGKVKAFAGAFGEAVSPISSGEHKKGDGIPRYQRMLGVNDAPSYLVDPKRNEAQQHRRDVREDKSKIRSDRRHRDRYE